MCWPLRPSVPRTPVRAAPGDTRDEVSWAATSRPHAELCGGCGGRTLVLAGGCAKRPTQVRSAPLPAHTSGRRGGRAASGAHPAHPRGSGFSRGATATGVTTVAWPWPGILLTLAVGPTQGTGDGDRLLGDRAQVAADLLLAPGCSARMRVHAELPVLADPPGPLARLLLPAVITHGLSNPPSSLPVLLRLLAPILARGLSLRVPAPSTRRQTTGGQRGGGGALLLAYFTYENDCSRER